MRNTLYQLLALCVPPSTLVLIMGRLIRTKTTHVLDLKVSAGQVTFVTPAIACAIPHRAAFGDDVDGPIEAALDNRLESSLRHDESPQRDIDMLEDSNCARDCDSQANGAENEEDHMYGQHTAAPGNKFEQDGECPNPLLEADCDAKLSEVGILEARLNVPAKLENIEGDDVVASVATPTEGVGRPHIESALPKTYRPAVRNSRSPTEQDKLSPYRPPNPEDDSSDYSFETSSVYDSDFEVISETSNSDEDKIYIAGSRYDSSSCSEFSPDIFFSVQKGELLPGSVEGTGTNANNSEKSVKFRTLPRIQPTPTLQLGDPRNIKGGSRPQVCLRNTTPTTESLGSNPISDIDKFADHVPGIIDHLVHRIMPFVSSAFSYEWEPERIEATLATFIGGFGNGVTFHGPRAAGSIMKYISSLDAEVIFVLSHNLSDPTGYIIALATHITAVRGVPLSVDGVCETLMPHLLSIAALGSHEDALRGYMNVYRCGPLEVSSIEDLLEGARNTTIASHWTRRWNAWLDYHPGYGHVQRRNRCRSVFRDLRARCYSPRAEADIVRDLHML